jgi:crotonobetainyl-CoA:carnitine CoA-transferase CaiB-like acyl-CoA transferase
MAGRLARRAVVDDGVRAWTRSLAPRAVTAAAQAHAVPAGFMQRITEYPDDPHFAARGFLQEMHQPGLDAPIVVETGPFTAPGIPVPEARPAPEHGEHTRELATALLGLDDAGVDALLQAGVLEAPVAAGVA